MATDRRANNPPAASQQSLCLEVPLSIYCGGGNAKPVSSRQGTLAYGCKARSGSPGRAFFAFLRQENAERLTPIFRDRFQIRSRFPLAALQARDAVTGAAEPVCSSGAAMAVRTRPPGTDKHLAGSVALWTFDRARQQGLVLRDTTFPLKNLDHLKTPRPKYG